MYEKTKKNCKTLLTRRANGGKIVEPLNGRQAAPRSEKKSKKFQKLWKKVLTRKRECGIIVKLSARRTANGH